MKKIVAFEVVIILALSSVISTCVMGQGVDATITIDGSTRYQQILGWEAVAQAGQSECAAFDAYRDEVFDRAVNELGLTRLRLGVRSGAEYDHDNWSDFDSGRIDYTAWKAIRYATVNDNNDPNVIDWSGFQFAELDDIVERVVLPVKQRVEARGETFFLNVNYVAFLGHIDTAKYQYHHDAAEEYAEFVLAAYLHLEQKYGLVPDAWEVILEPDNSDWQWTGTYIGQVIVATAQRLEAAGFTPHFIAPSTTRMDNAVPYFDAMMAVPGMQASWLLELSYHRYGGVSASNLAAIADRARQYGIGTAMLEHMGSGYEDLHEDLKVGENTAWQQFALAYCSGTNDNGGAYYVINESAPGGPSVKLGSRSWYLRQYFLRVRPGAQRVEATTTNGSFDALTFVNTDGGYAVVVKAQGGGTVEVEGLPSGRYRIGYTTSSVNDGDGGEVVIGSGEALRASIPGQGVLAVYNVAAAPNLPGAVQLSSPADGEASASTTPAFSWQTTNGATSYELQIASDATFSSVLVNKSGLTGASYAHTGQALAAGTTYYWRVRAVNAAGAGAYSPVWSFTTATTSSSPATPQLSAPTDGAASVSTTPALSWQNASGAATYELQIANSAAFTSALVDKTDLTGTSYTYAGNALTAGATYYWRVRAVNAAGMSAYSSVRDFTTAVSTATEDERERTWKFKGSYPNPASSSATFAFEVPEPAHVILKVYDVSGKEVATLVDSWLTAGYHESTWKVGGLPNGMYFCRLTAEAFNATQKLVVIK